MFVQYHENEPECLLIGTIGRVHYYNNVGGKGKRLVNFKVSSSKINEFGEYESEMFECVAWGKLADLANSLGFRTTVRIDGFYEKNEYAKKHQIRCEFITVLQEPPTSEQDKPKKKDKAQASDWEDTEIDF